MRNKKRWGLPYFPRSNLWTTALLSSAIWGFHLPWTLLKTTSLAPGASRTDPLLDWRQAGGGAVGPTSIQQWIRTQGSHDPDISDPCERDGSSPPLGGQSPPLDGYITAGICSGGSSPKPWIVFTQPPVYGSPECQNIICLDIIC